MLKKHFTLLVSICTILSIGFAFINIVYNETYMLLVYDLKTGFTDNVSYAVSAAVLIVLTAILGGGIWRILFGRIHVIVMVTIRGRLFVAATDEDDGADINADRRIDLAFVLNVICSAVIIACMTNFIAFFTETNITEGTWGYPKTVGHSFGAADGYDYTGSLEAFLYNYKLGRRTMEVDLILTTDDRLVLKHDWDTPEQFGISEDNPPDEETFLNTKILGKYTPLSFSGLCELMVEYPDIWIITDTKSVESEEIKKQFAVMLDTVHRLGCEEILDRLIIQVYHEEMYQIVNDIYRFDNYIFTMYWRFDSDDWLETTKEVCRFCVNNGIETITIGTNRISPEMEAVAERYGRKVYIHTVNDLQKAEQYFQMGVTGIYTDIITDEDLRQSKTGDIK